MKLAVGALLVSLLGTTAHAQDEGAQDFIAEAKVFYRVVACGGTDPLPANADAAVVEKHCTEMTKRYESFRGKYIDKAREFFAGVQPAGLPSTVVYPFGGGDLVGALVTYPNATEITTISLEHGGDPTRLGKLTKKQLNAGLMAFRASVAGLLSLNDSTSENMRKLEKGGIPGQLSFHITGLVAMGMEPVALKYFTLNPDGTIHYFTKTEIDAVAKKLAKKKKGGWIDTDFSEAFTNMELTFRKAGDAKAPLVVHRHFAANLANNAFDQSPLQKHLEAKGKIVAMTKAASFLIWLGGFSKIRDYLLANMVWMASDATGIAPRFAKKAGFKQTTYGQFAGPFLPEAEATTADEMVKMWAAQPRRKLPFRYGYPDSEKRVHLMITEPKK
jgi:hypothetical protein